MKARHQIGVGMVAALALFVLGFAGWAICNTFMYNLWHGIIGLGILTYLVLLLICMWDLGEEDTDER